jgi:RNA polymerase sigma-70 factor, ECF subfamily
MATSVAGNAPSERDSVQPSVSWHDEDLVALVLCGDTLAFDRIVEKHRRWVYTLCSRILRSPDSAADLTQEVFARALEKMPMLQQRARLAGWLKVIAVNQCRTVIEKQRLYDPLGGEESVRPTNLTPEQQMIASERRELVEKLIDQLPPKQQLVFVMKYIDGYSYRQISELTGFSDKQLKSYLQNARRNFEKSWTERRKKR